MLVETNGTWMVQLADVPYVDWPYWFQQAALKNGTLSSDVKLLEKPVVKNAKP